MSRLVGGRGEHGMKRLAAACILVSTLTLTAGDPAGAAWYTYHRTITHPSGTVSFGTSMAAVGDRFLVGNPSYDGAVLDSGAVHVVDARTGEIVRTIVNPVPVRDAGFGISVALRGPDIVVGAPYQPVGSVLRAGAVFVFDGETGALLRTIPNPAPEAEDRFGTVAANGDDILIGARGVGTNPVPGRPAPGAAFLYDGATGALVHTFRDLGPAVLNVGSAVGFVGADPIIGAANDSTRFNGEGGAYVFDRATGALRLTLRPPVARVGTGFASRVGAMGDRPLVAAVFDDTAGMDTGAVYLFDATGSVAGAFPNPVPEHVVPFGAGQVSIDDIDDRLLVAGFTHSREPGATDGDSVYVIDGDTGDLLQTLEAPEPYGTDLQSSYVVATGGRIVVSSFGALHVFDPAGNDYVGNGEECDDGNTDDGDGCSARSRIEPGFCRASPRSDCHPAAAHGGVLAIKTGDGSRASLSWKLKSGAGGTTIGDPTVDTGYRLCLYDGTTLRRGLAVPAAGTCAGVACWRARGNGFAYRDPARATDGIVAARLATKSSGAVTLGWKGQGALLSLPALPFAAPVEVQLVSTNGACWTSTFSAPSRNVATMFKAKSD